MVVAKAKVVVKAGPEQREEEVHGAGVSVSRVRILPIVGRENCYRLSFVADADGVVRLVLEEAGDSSTMERDDVSRRDRGHLTRSCASRKGSNCTIVDITSDGPLRRSSVASIRCRGRCCFWSTSNEVRSR